MLWPRMPAGERIAAWVTWNLFFFWPLLRSPPRKTECSAKQFLACFVVRAAPFALLRNSRKTECGAKQFLVCFVVRAAPFAL
jgi:hypothetical protein